ncbi:MAG: Crp/Fnr family transcriptional regulator [Candidatus Saccharimonadales bacterium]
MSDFHHWAHAHETYFHTHGRRTSYKKHQMLVRREEESPWMFFVESGYVKMMFTNETGEERVLGFGMPGMTIAQSGSFYSLPHTELEYEAHTECQVWRVPRSQFINDLPTDAALMADWHQIVLQNQNMLIERILYLGEKQPRKRIIAWLLGMSRYYGTLQPNNEIHIEIPLTQDAIASFVHLSRESTSRIISELKQLGVITMQQHLIVIPKLDELQRRLYE